MSGPSPLPGIEALGTRGVTRALARASWGAAHLLGSSTFLLACAFLSWSLLRNFPTFPLVGGYSRGQDRPAFYFHADQSLAWYTGIDQRIPQVYFQRGDEVYSGEVQHAEVAV